MERYLNLSLPFGLAPTEATIGSYRQKPSARALHRVYSVEATFGSEKRSFHRYETGGEPWPMSAASSYQLLPHWHKASGSESQEKMLHSVSDAGRGGENAMGSQIHRDFESVVRRNMGKDEAIAFRHSVCFTRRLIPMCLVSLADRLQKHLHFQYFFRMLGSDVLLFGRVVC